jgi:hemerythrin-like metal-binding protein
VYHFGTEEKYFRQFKFQDSEEHILEHNEFKKTVLHFQKQLEKNKAALTFEVINFLRNWLLKHIAVSDKKYSKCFIDNGLK